MKLGNLMSMCLAQGGAFFSNAVYDWICDKEPTVDIDSVLDDEAREVLLKVNSYYKHSSAIFLITRIIILADEGDSLQEILTMSSDFMYDRIGYDKPLESAKLSNRDDICSLIFLKYTIATCSAELEQR